MLEGATRSQGDGPRLGLDAKPGTYALILFSPVTRSVRVGRLGMMEVRRGHYIYIGSAHGPGGLGARVKRHLKPQATSHWHIDYLRRVTELCEVWITRDRIRREHQWAAVLSRIAGTSMGRFGFGASDCRCDSHLIRFPQKPKFHEFRDMLSRSYRGHGPMVRIGLPPRRKGKDA
jgi:Uri superfamily endonuclease